MQKKHTNFVVKGALIGAVYTVLTLALGAVSYGNLGIEFRVSEALTILPIFTFSAVPGLFAGCVIANLIGMAFSGLGMVDVVFGSLATLIAALISWLLRNVTIKGFPFWSFLPPIIANAVIVGIELRLFVPDAFSSFLWAFFIVGTGEAVVVFVLGTPLYFLVKKNKFLNNFLQ